MDSIDCCCNTFCDCAHSAFGCAQPNDQAVLSGDINRIERGPRMGEKFKVNKSTDELRTKIASSRERVDCALRGVHYELDFPAKLQRSFRKRTVSWLACSTNKDLVETGFALGALKIGASLVRPAIVELIKSRLMGVSGRPRTNK